MRALFTKSLRQFVLSFVLILFAFIANAQLKIGDNPTTINKSSILELESDRQGLLLTRVADTSLINALNPPDGTIIYLSTDNSLRLRSNGYWKKMIVDTVMENTIRAINGIQKKELSITAAANDTMNTVTVENRSADSTITIYLPVQDGSAGSSKPYGFLTYADWQKIQSGLQEIAIGTVATTSTANGASITVTDSLRTIKLHPADASNPGIVTASVQTFGGNKAFQDSVAAAKAILVGTTGNANSTVQVSGSMSLAIKTVTADYTATVNDNTILANTTSAAITVTLPSASGIAGRIYTIKKIGSGGINRELTVAPASGTIDGGSNYVIYNDWTHVAMQTDGTNWFIIRR